MNKSCQCHLGQSEGSGGPCQSCLSHHSRSEALQPSITFPPPPFPAEASNATISAFDRYFGTLDGSWRGGWGDREHGTDKWVDPSLRNDSLQTCCKLSLADIRRSEGAVKRRERLRRIYHALVDNPAEALRIARAAPRNEALPYSHSPDFPYTRSAAASKKESLSWSTFCDYCTNKELELWNLYQSLDRNGDHVLCRDEITQAFKSAHLDVGENTVKIFFSQVGSGTKESIGFEQFRDFFLLLANPANVTEIFVWFKRKSLRGASLVTSDGDVSIEVNDEASAGQSRKTGALHSVEKESIESESTVPRAAENQLHSRNHLYSRSHLNSDSQHHSRSVEQPAVENGDGQEEDEIYDDEELDEVDNSVFAFFHGEMALKVFGAGGVAGAVSRTATAPFDRLKVHLITVVKPKTVIPPSGSTPAPLIGFAVLKEAVTTIYRKGGGLKAFWVGNGVNIMKIFPESAIKFLSYETSKRMFAKYWDQVEDQRDISGSSRFMAGGLGGIASQLSIYPVETLKTRMMSSENSKPENRKGLMSSVGKDIWRRGGVRGYYRGLTAGLIGVFPYSAIDMSTFEALKLAYLKYTDKEDAGVLATLAFGSFSGSVGATSVYPLNLLRTRLQASGTAAHPQVYTGFFDVMQTTYHKEGVRGFYRGLSPTLLKVVPAVSISYVVYDFVKKQLGVI